MSHWHQQCATSEFEKHLSVAENNQFNVSASRYQDVPCGVTEANTRVGLFSHQYNWFWFQWIQLLFLFHVVYVPLILSSMSDLPGAQNRSNSITTQLKLGIIIWLLMQPVGTVCQWRGRPFLKHSGPHQPTVLRHPFRNNSKPSTPAASCHAPPYPPLLSLLCPAKSTKKQQKMKTNVELIHFDFIVAWNYLCSYASTSHIYTQNTHWGFRHKSRNKHAHTHVASFEHTILCNWLENWKHFYFKS